MPVRATFACNVRAQPNVSCPSPPPPPPPPLPLPPPPPPPPPRPGPPPPPFVQNPWWAVFSGVFEKHGWSTVPEVFPAATDSRYLRALNIPCFGFSPMNHTPILLHDNNEYLHRDVYLRGITVYEALLQGLADAPAHL